MSNTNLNGASGSIHSCNENSFSNSNISNAYIQFSGDGFDFEHSNLQDSDFSGSNIYYSSFSNSSINNSNLSDSILYGVFFNNSDLKGTNFANSTFIDVHFVGADLRSSNFFGVQLCVEYFEFAECGQRSTFDGSLYNESTVFAQGMDPQSLGIIFVSEVPLPAGIYLFLSGLVGLDLVKRK